ncbi:MAG: hypothetical protein R2764_01030 [Bacteroidales bacterium]
MKTCWRLRMSLDNYNEDIEYMVDEIKNAIKQLSEDDRVIISFFFLKVTIMKRLPRY